MGLVGAEAAVVTGADGEVQEATSRAGAAREVMTTATTARDTEDTTTPDTAVTLDTTTPDTTTRAGRGTDRDTARDTPAMTTVVGMGRTSRALGTTAKVSLKLRVMASSREEPPQPGVQEGPSRPRDTSPRPRQPGGQEPRAGATTPTSAKSLHTDRCLPAET